MKSGVATPALQVRPRSATLNRFFVKTVLPPWDRNERRWLTWRAVTWCYAAFAIVIGVAMRRRGWRFLLAMAPGFAAWFSVLTFTPGQSARYMFPAYLCALATLPLLSLLWRDPRPRRGVRAVGPSSGDNAIGPSNGDNAIGPSNGDNAVGPSDGDNAVDKSVGDTAVSNPVATDNPASDDES